MPEKNVRTGWFFRDEEPSNDNEYFENMTRTVFQAGLSWQLISDKWSNFRKAFKDFDIEKVSDFDEEDIERLVSDSGIIRNRAKIESTIVNAIAFLKIREEYESFRNFIDNMDRSENYKFVKKELAKRFQRMGPKTAMIFLYSIGEDIKHED
ncbi:MAG: DNA-3-methyladenine glycosylase I [Candidatus Heimdallarchaeota archaeon]|nr:DNA-3-methyladenine glycosylase I [Candidatus Heimdallarchaeota archaeon]MCK4953756.1 DNA-3-methyladenine glycosylase I [Candidatus Heimdallarchaeota archaeon]